METADFGYSGTFRVEFVAPIYMNPKQPKHEDERRRKDRKKLYDTGPKKEEREMPENSTVSYYA